MVWSILTWPRGLEGPAHMEFTIGTASHLRPSAEVEIMPLSPSSSLFADQMTRQSKEVQGLHSLAREIARTRDDQLIAKASDALYNLIQEYGKPRDRLWEELRKNRSGE